MTEGINLNAGVELGTSVPLYPEQLSIPPANISIGGASYRVGPIFSVGGVVATTIIGAALAISGYPIAADEHVWPTVEITVDPHMHSAHCQMAGVDLKLAYDELRRQMIDQGIPFLDATSLEQEIADRKGRES